MKSKTLTMNTPTQKFLPIQGLEVVGHGVYVRPNQPYELKPVLFPRDNDYAYYSKETEATWAIPDGYEVNDSPPMPAAQALNQTVIEESWERFEKQQSLDASLAVSNAPFSVDVNASQTGQLRQEEEAYYALRNSFIPLWALYIPGQSAYSLRHGSVSCGSRLSEGYYQQLCRGLEVFRLNIDLERWNMAESDTRLERAAAIVKAYILAAMLIGLMPLPLVVGLAAQAAIQLKMLHSLANLYDREFSSQLGASLVASFLGGGIPVIVGAVLWKSIPLYGWAVGLASTAVLAGASTYTVGKVFIMNLESGGTFLTFDPQAVRDYYAQQSEKEKEEVRRFVGVKP